MRILLLSLLFILIALHVEAKPLVLSVIPIQENTTVTQEFLPLTTYLEEKLHTNVTLNVAKTYQDVIEAFKNNQTDLAYLGPLPFATLQKSTPSFSPIVTFKQKDGQTQYRCVLVKFAKDSLPRQDTTAIKVALTQPLSTCGYMQTKLLIHKFLHEDLYSMHYQYMGNHDTVALSILRGDFLLGGMKESIAQKYASLGLEILSYSAPVPGLMLIANTNTLSKEEIDTIQKILLDTPKEIYQAWGESLSYGMSIPNLQQFTIQNFGDLNYTIPKNGNF